LENILGCSVEQLQKHLNTTFINNYDNNDELHIDHIIPISKATTIDEVYELNNYTNLQYLLAKDNLIKGVK